MEPGSTMLVVYKYEEMTSIGDGVELTRHLLIGRCSIVFYLTASLMLIFLLIRSAGRSS